MGVTVVMARKTPVLVSVVSVSLVVAVAACGGGEAAPPGPAGGVTPASEPAAIVESPGAPPEAPLPADAAPADPQDASEPVPESAEAPLSADAAPADSRDESEPAPESPEAEPPAAVDTIDAAEPAAGEQLLAEPDPAEAPEAPPEDPGAAGASLAELVGHWEGGISIPGTTDLPFAVDLTASGDGLRGTIEIQGVSGLPLSNVTLDGGRLHFELNSPLGLAVWDGDLHDGVIEGEFTQGEMAETFWMQQFDDPASGDGASYRREEVVFSNGEIVLAGELVLPDGDGPHPAAVLISGSGDQDRDSNLGGFRVFAVLADHLAGAGIASLRFDDRGVGGSTGDGLQATLHDRAGDVAAAVELLRTREDIAAGGIGLIGHSEGGIVAPVVANSTGGVAFAALLAAPAVPLVEILVAQQQALLEESGSSADDIEEYAALQESVFRAIATGEGWDGIEASMRALVLRQFEAFSEEVRESIPDEDALVDSIVAEELATWRSPWFASFLEHDPREAVVALDVPVVALFGELDTQVPAPANSIAMSEAIAESNVSGYTIATIFSANHLFQEAVTGSVNEYARLKRQFAPDFVDILLESLAEMLRWGS